MTDNEALTVSRPSLPVAALKALRPHQWAKNVLLFAALVFSGSFMQIDRVLDALLAFAAFSLLASAGYLLNDYLDREQDRKHPRKRHRPIASGALPEWAALVEMLVIAAAGVGLALWLSKAFLAISLVYLATTLTYSFWLKHIVIVDVMVLATHYVWRAVAGAVAIEVSASPWLFLCTAFLALFLGFEKRKGELRLIGPDGPTRKILTEYNLPMVNGFQAIVTASAMLCYALYAVLGPTPWMVVTVPHVLYCMFRYIYLVERYGEGAAPDETLLRDKPIIATIMVYGLTAMAILWALHAALLPEWIA